VNEWKEANVSGVRSARPLPSKPRVPSCLSCLFSPYRHPRTLANTTPTPARHLGHDPPTPRALASCLHCLQLPPRRSCPLATDPFVFKDRLTTIQGGQESYRDSPNMFPSVLRASAEFLVSCLPFSTFVRTHPRAQEHAQWIQGQGLT
jgi:hypothetical protein